MPVPDNNTVLALSDLNVVDRGLQECKVVKQACRDSNPEDPQRPTVEADVYFSRVVRDAKRQFWRRIIEVIEDARAALQHHGMEQAYPKGWLPPFKADERTVETKAEKAATLLLLTSIIDRCPPEADLQFEPIARRRRSTHVTLPSVTRRPWSSAGSMKFGITDNFDGRDSRGLIWIAFFHF